MKINKPSGLKFGKVSISIDDGFVEWKYIIEPVKFKSIDKTIKLICKALKAKLVTGEIRTSHYKKPQSEIKDKN